MDEAVSYDKAELRSVIRAFKAMDDEAIAQARAVSNDLATKLSNAISAASSAYGLGAQRVAYGVRVSKSSKVGEFAYGYKSQRFSGGGTTQLLWPGLEFGSNRYKQFGTRSKKGKFIYPTLRALQPFIVKEWENAFDKILKEW